MIGRRIVVQTDSVARRGNLRCWKISVSIALMVPFAALLYCPSTISAEPLSTSERFAVLSAFSVADPDSTIITGDLGLSPDASITGLESVALTGTVHQSEGTPPQAQVGLAASYTTSSHLPSTSDLARQNLGGLTLRSGIYDSLSSLHMAGTHPLKSLSDPNDSLFGFQVGSSLTNASGSAIRRFGGENNRLSWQVGSSATDGDLAGPALVADVPEPGTISLICVGFLALALYGWQSRKRVS